MKYLYTIAFICMALLFVCGELSAAMPGSALLHVDTAHLYALRDSNLALYEQSKRQGQYRQAVEYNAQYRLYNDSILQVRRNRELAGVRAAYDREKQTGEQNLLALEKIRIQTIWMIALAVCLCTGGGALLFYQRRLIRKERAIRRAKKRLQELTEQMTLNQLAIQSNEDVIQMISEQLERHTELEEQVREQQADMERIRETNRQLLQQNMQLGNEVNQYTSLLQDAGTGQPASGWQAEESRMLQKREKHFAGILLLHMELAGQLKGLPRAITPEEGRQLMAETEEIYPGFVKYVRHTFPRLSDLDVLHCCLIKLNFATSEIAVVMGVDVPSVSKRKLRIKERMREAIPDIWEGKESLDVYIYQLTVDKLAIWKR
ncbi:MAG: hypothetical protein LBF62_04875 [Tannerellaceae bacterium]|jgi:ABC-type multidrug transport system fused ATPase/permease subunit|nr:hypothetical protein [Tannerellaceae bacterium]